MDNADNAAFTYRYEHRRILEWAPAIGNGTALVALTNVVANAPNQDRALDGLTLPLAAFGLGLCIGIVALLLAVRSFDHQSSVISISHRLHDTINPLIARFNEAEGAEKVALGKQLQALGSNAAAEEPRLRTNLKLYRRYGRGASILNALATVTCGGGFSALLIGHWLGWLRLG